jgi:hypothetical protein
VVTSLAILDHSGLAAWIPLGIWQLRLAGGFPASVKEREHDKHLFSWHEEWENGYDRELQTTGTSLEVQGWMNSPSERLLHGVVSYNHKQLTLIRYILITGLELI